MIELEALVRTFEVGEQTVRALDGVTETVGDGEHVAIMGPSGSGKTTLLNILGCLDRPSGGIYRLDGRSVEAASEEERTAIRKDKIGFVFQFFQLVPRLTALENVALPLLFDGMPKSHREELARAALERVGLLDRALHRPDQLSGGERQRVALARAVVRKPALLLADEPTGNLDTVSGSAVLDLLDELNDEGLTIVVVSHDPNVARRADRVIFMVDGRIAKVVPGEQVHELIAAL